MSLLFPDKILSSIEKELKGAEKSVQIISAYCKETSFKFLDECIKKENINKSLLIRFRMDDILKGSTDFSVIKTAFDSGWNVYLRFDLHAKTYIVDNKRCLIGSANATNSGLNLGSSGNLEMATLVDIEEADIVKIDRLFTDAIVVDDELYLEMKKQLDNVINCKATQVNMWGENITKLFNPSPGTLFSYELPDHFNLAVGEYFSFLDETYTDIDSFRLKFRWCNSYLWLLNTLKENNGCLYFGGLTEKLHNVLINDPKPYRKDVKIMLSNLLKFVEMLKMDEITIDRPNYSQRIRLR